MATDLRTLIYYYYDRITSQHQKRIGVALKLVGRHMSARVEVVAL